jgi:hypothetical protein
LSVIRLRVAVQHHPSRSHLLADLAGRLGEHDVVCDPDPDGKPRPLRTYVEALRRATDDETHTLIVQDDAWPCRGFREKAEAALAEKPGVIVCFFVPDSGGGGGKRVQRAARAGEKWALLGAGGWIPAVATAWPRALIDPFLAFATQPRFAGHGADDGMIARFARQHRRSSGVEVWATVPSLVDHPDHEPSLLGKRHGGGSIRWRVAALFDDR